MVCLSLYANQFSNVFPLSLQTAITFGAKLSKPDLVGITIYSFVSFISPPSSSTLMRTGRALSFETLQSECAHYERNGWVLLCGDFNARTNDVNDYIENDELDDTCQINN